MGRFAWCNVGALNGIREEYPFRGALEIGADRPISRERRAARRRLAPVRPLEQVNAPASATPCGRSDNVSRYPAGEKGLVDGDLAFRICAYTWWLVNVALGLPCRKSRTWPCRTQVESHGPAVMGLSR